MAIIARRATPVVLALLGFTLAAPPARAQSVKVGGVVYSQYGLQLADEADNYNAFDITRAYLDFRASFDGGVTTRVTTDLHRTSDGSLTYRLKYAYFTWTPESWPVTLKFGQIHTPWLDWEEGLWGYRMQGTMALEHFGYATSSDLGAGIQGAWRQQKLNMEAVVVNGEGYHGAEGDNHKDAGARVSYRLMGTDDGGSRGGLRVTGMARVGTYTGGGTRRRLLGMLSYKSSRLTLAGEVGRVTDGGPDPAPNVDGNFMSLYGVVKVPDSKVALLGRVDVGDPNVDAPNDRQTHMIGGVSYVLSPNVLLLLDLDHTSYQGEPPSDAAAAARSTLLFQAQFTF